MPATTIDRIDHCRIEILTRISDCCQKQLDDQLAVVLAGIEHRDRCRCRSVPCRASSLYLRSSRRVRLLLPHTFPQSRWSKAQHGRSAIHPRMAGSADRNRLRTRNSRSETLGLSASRRKDRSPARCRLGASKAKFDGSSWQRSSLGWLRLPRCSVPGKTWLSIDNLPFRVPVSILCCV
jgi:hypothetical protein